MRHKKAPPCNKQFYYFNCLPQGEHITMVRVFLLTNKGEETMAKWITNMTPEQAWHEFVTDTVERFISNFRSEGYTDINAACTRYSQDIPGLYNRPFSQNQLAHITVLLNRYIDSYIDKKGGMDKLRLYTNEELDEMDAIETKEILDLLKEF